MIGHETERWMVLCGQAAVEQDPKKLLALTKEITRLLEEKEARLKGNPPPPTVQTPKPSASSTSS
jgi:hypothetical protein